MKRKGILYLLIIILVAVGVGLFFFDQESPIQGTVEKIITGQQGLFNNEELDEQDSGENNQGSSESSGGGGGGSSGGGGGGGSSGGSSSCPQKQISYSLKQFSEQFACLEYTPQGCTRIQGNCTVEVHNLDTEGDGTFRMSFDLIDAGVVVDIIEDFADLNPGESTVLGGSWDLQDEQGLNENLDCDFNTKEIPTKDDC